MIIAHLYSAARAENIEKFNASCEFLSQSIQDKRRSAVIKPVGRYQGSNYYASVHDAP